MGRTTILVLLYAVLGHGYVVSGQDDNTQNRIPDGLLECYNSPLHNRENLLPMTMKTLINIIRKVEDSQAGRNMDLRTMASALLYRFRLDGVVKDPDVPISEGVLPYAVQGKQFYKHRIILKALIPESTILFPNETITSVERCTLHFMLSSTIELWERGDENQVCGVLSNLGTNGGIRRRRHIEDTNSSKGDVTSEEEVSKEESTEGKHVEDKQIEDDQVEDDQVEDKHVEDKETEDVIPEVKGIQNVSEVLLTNNGTQTSSQDVLADTDVEVVDKNASRTSGKSGAMFLDENELYRPSVRENLNPMGRLTHADNIQTVPISSCPQESGVVYTNWGTVAAGTVIAGLAAGTQQQTVPIRELAKGAKLNKKLVQEVEDASPTINNVYSVTIAGDLAEVTLHQGPKQIKSVGAKGGWNDTAIPRHYFLKKASEENFLMTDAEILGGIDGLIMAHKISDWIQKTNGDLKLSQVLDHYYSEKGMFEEKFRACERQKAFSEVNSISELEKQTIAFSTVLDTQSLTAATLTFAKISEFSKTAVQAFNTYKETLLQDTPKCSPTLVDPKVDMYVMIDKAWPYRQMQSVLLRLMSKINISPEGSNITVLDGKNRDPFIVSCNNDIDFFSNFTEEIYNTHESGMQLGIALEGDLKALFKSLLERDRLHNLSTGNPIVLLLIPSLSSSISDWDLQASILSFQTYKHFLPDVKIFYLVPDNKERYVNLVDKPEKDIFVLAQGIDNTNIEGSVDPLADAINQVPRRMLNPVCGSTFLAQPSVKLEMTETVIAGGKNQYILRPHYFYDSIEETPASVKVQGQGPGTLTVCYSRDNVSGTSSNTTCKPITTETVNIPLNNPCEGSETLLDCPPLFLSIQSTGEPVSYTCKDEVLCKFITDIQYTISQEGLICTSGVGRVSGSFGIVGLTVTLLIAIKATLR